MSDSFNYIKSTKVILREKEVFGMPKIPYGPTYDEMLNPSHQDPDVRMQAIKALKINEFDPINLFNITWKNENNDVNKIVLPRELTGVDANIIVMLGKYFPSGSHKVGPAYSTLIEGCIDGDIIPGKHTILGASTGNFGIGVSYIANLMKYDSVVVMPNNMSKERYERIKKYGAKLDLIEGSDSGIISTLERSYELVKNPKNKLLAQFELLPNYRFHRYVTGNSAIEAVKGIGNGRISCFCSAPGSGGTLGAGDGIKAVFPECKIVALENVLNRTVMDSLKEMAVSFKNFNETLLSDINENPDIAIVLNNHPEILRIYLNSFNAPSLRKKPSHLFYWGHTADSHKELLGKKKKHIINAKSIIFQENGNQVDMYLSGKIIAKYANDIITCNSIELLNLIGKPSTTYKYQDFTCSTDHMGRTKEIKQTLKNKGKCSDKSKIKPKEYVFLHGNTETNKLIQLGVVNYGAPMTLLNSFFIKDSPKSARVIKEIKKSEKSYLKSEVSGTVSYSLIYDNGQRIPLQIKISYGNAQPIIIINDRAESGI